jgi:hypothetical protein
MTQAGQAVERPPIWALLVGVNRYANPDIAPLQGCVPDVQAFAAYLREQLGVPPAQIRLLCDEEATYAQVIAGFETFLMQAPPGDQAVVYFSCHGSQSPAIDPSIEADGLDESLVLHDSRTGDTFDLLDKELGYLLDRVVQRGLNVTVILDACHSGSGVRFDEGDVRVRRWRDPDLRPRTLAQVYGGQAAFDLARRQQVRQSWLNPGAEGQSYVVLSACQDVQLAREMVMADGKPHGLMSWMLLEELQRGLPPDTTYDDVFRVVRARVRSQIKDQEPHYEGDLTRKVFAAGRLLKQAPLTIRSLAGTLVTLEGGLNHGLTAGSLLLAYPPFSDRSDPEQALARLQIARVTPLDAMAKIVAWLPAGTNGPDAYVLPISAQVVVEAYGAEAECRVWLDGPGLEPLRGVLEQFAQRSRFVRLAAQPDEAQVIVRSEGGLLHALDVEQVPICKPVATRDLETLAARIEHAARFWFNSKIMPNPSEDRLSRYVEFTLCRVVQGQWQPLDRAAPEVQTGDMLGLRFVSRYDEPLHVSVWDFSRAEFAVTPLYPSSGATERLMPGGMREYQLEFPVSLSEGQQESRSLVRLFVTNAPTTAFQHLRMEWIESVRRGAMRGEEQVDFFGETSSGAPQMRSGPASVLQSWGAQSLTVRIVARR